MKQAVAIALLGFFVHLKAQEYSITRYDHLNGLADSYVFKVYHDHVGYLWIGTHGGVSRFDGEEFVNYGYANGMSDVRVDAMYHDKQGRFWLGTRGGICHLHAGRGIAYPLSDNGNVKFVFQFLELNSGDLLALTDFGVYIWQENHWQKKEFYPGTADHACRQMVETTDGLLINYGEFIVQQSADLSWKMITEKQRYAFWYNRMQQAGGNVFVSTVDGVHQIKQGKLVRLPGPAGIHQGVYTFMIDSKLNCWVGSDHAGVIRYHVYDTAINQVILDPVTTGPVSHLHEYPESVIWIAAADGLIRLSPVPFNRLPLDSDRAVVSVTHGINGAILVSDGNTLVSTEAGELSTLRHVPIRGRKHTGALIIDHYAYDSLRKKMWIQTRGFEMGEVQKNQIEIRTDEFDFPNEEIFDLIYDNVRQRLIAAFLGETVPCMEENGKFSPMQLDGCTENKEIISEVHQCLDGTLLFCTANGVIYAIDTLDDCRRVYVPDQGKYPCKFLNDPGGGVWLLYQGRGARRFALKDTLVLSESLDASTSLSSDIVNGLCFDPYQRLWIWTPLELGVFSRDSVHGGGKYRKIASFSQPDLNMVIGHANSIACDSAGIIWLGAGQVVLRIDSRSITTSHLSVPSLEIEEVILNEGALDWSRYAGSFDPVSGIPVNPELPHAFDVLRIRYNGILPYENGGMQYSYMLSPLSGAWSESTTEEAVSFYKLPSGNYHFQVRTCVAGNPWSEPKSFAFKVATPFWETLWFRTLVVCTAAGILIVAFRYRMRQLYKKARAKQQLRELELNALKSQMNPHFIHNALNSIQSLILNDHSQEASHYVSKFARLLRQVLESAEKQLIPLEQELAALRLYVDLERLRMNMSFAYEEYVDPDISIYREMVPPLILQPFVENALWHGLAEKEGNKVLTLKVTTEGSWLLCVIADNGIGRAQAATKQAFPEGSLSKSVEITRKRLVAFNQDPSLPPLEYTDINDADQNTGTTVTIRVRRPAADLS